MAQRTISSLHGTLGLFLLILPLVASPPADGSQILGQILSAQTELDGVRVPSGTTLVSDSGLRTFAEPALVHLHGGRILWLADRSFARFVSTPEGRVRMDVETGRLTLRGPGVELSLAANDSALLPQGSGAIPQSGIGSGAAVGSPFISDAEKPCLPGVPYPMIDAEIRPGNDVQVAKVYFRAGQFPDFYAVEMSPRAIPNAFEAVLPTPSPGTDEVVYYVEAVSSTFAASRTEDFVARVESEEECRKKRRGAGLFTGANPQIEVLATVEGAPALPPGFSSSGLVNVAAGGAGAAGAGSGGGFLSGLGPAGLAGVVVGTAAGGLLLIDEIDDDDEQVMSPIVPP